MFPQEGIFYAVFLHRGISARYDCHRPWSRSGVWGVINLLEGYGNDNRATRS